MSALISFLIMGYVSLFNLAALDAGGLSGLIEHSFRSFISTDLFTAVGLSLIGLICWVMSVGSLNGRISSFLVNSVNIVGHITTALRVIVNQLAWLFSLEHGDFIRNVLIIVTAVLSLVYLIAYRCGKRKNRLFHVKWPGVKYPKNKSLDYYCPEFGLMPFTGYVLLYVLGATRLNGDGHISEMIRLYLGVEASPGQWVLPNLSNISQWSGYTWWINIAMAVSLVLIIAGLVLSADNKLLRLMAIACYIWLNIAIFLGLITVV